MEAHICIMKRLYKILIPVYLATSLYAITRYHIYGPVLWKDLCLFTVNKILIFSAILLLLILSLNKKLKDEDRAVIKNIIFISIVLHILFSSLILKPYYLKSFFTPDKSFSLWGNISLLFGGLAAMVYLLKDQWSFPNKNRRLVFLSFTGVHLISMGWHGWLHPDTWHGHLPPITLISFVGVVLIVLMTFKRK